MIFLYKHSPPSFWLNAFTHTKGLRIPEGRVISPGENGILPAIEPPSEGMRFTFRREQGRKVHDFDTRYERIPSI